MSLDIGEGLFEDIGMWHTQFCKLNTRGCHNGSFVVNGGTGSCRCD